MPRESAYDRGRRLLVEGRVTVRRVAGDTIDADVRGDSATVHRVRHLPRAGWACTCPALRTCAHLVAVQLIVTVPCDG